MVFIELWRQGGVSNGVRWGAQGASRVAPEKLGPHANDEGEHVIALEAC